MASVSGGEPIDKDAKQSAAEWCSHALGQSMMSGCGHPGWKPSGIAKSRHTEIGLRPACGPCTSRRFSKRHTNAGTGPCRGLIKSPHNTGTEAGWHACDGLCCRAKAGWIQALTDLTNSLSEWQTAAAAASSM